MNIIPNGYPNLWVSHLKRWVSEEYYLIDVDPIGYEQMIHGAYDEECGIAFVTRKFQEDDLTYSIMLASVGVVGDDVHLYSIERLFGTNEIPNYDSVNYSAERLIKHGNMNYFQHNERYFAHIQEVVSVLKRDILLVVDGIWYQSNYIKPI